MRRVLSVFLPRWPTDRVARKHGLDRSRHVLVVAVKADRQLVMDASADALEAGVRPGMDVAHARALLTGGEPMIAPHKPQHDAAAINALAQWAVRWSPMTAPDFPDGILLDITGCEHLFGGESVIVRQMRRKLHRLGFANHMAAASTIGAAWGLARFSPTTPISVESGKERDALASLPVEALRLGPESVEALNEVGIVRVGQLLDVPRAMLPARYGEELIVRLDQALGHVAEQVLHSPVTAPLVVSIELPGGTTQWEAVSLAAWQLLTQVVAEVERRESGVRHLDAVFTRLDAESVRLVVQVSRPTRNAKHLWALLRPKLDRLNLGYGITGISLHARVVSRIAHEQVSLLDTGEETSRGDAAIDQTIDTIANRLGRAHVCRVSCPESHRPERAACTTPLVDATPAELSTRRETSERPSVLYPSPEPVGVMSLSPDGPVMSLRLRGVEHRVTTSVGPERIGGEWWRTREPSRDYFRVQVDTGRWLWLFREFTGRWFVHGEWA